MILEYFPHYIKYKIYYHFIFTQLYVVLLSKIVKIFFQIFRALL